MLPPSMQNNARESLGSEGIVDVLMVHWIEGVTDWIPSARGEAARIEALEPGWSERNNFLLLRPDVFEHVGRLLDFSDMGIFDKLSGNLDRCHTHIPLDGYGKSQVVEVEPDLLIKKTKQQQQQQQQQAPRAWPALAVVELARKRPCR